MDFFDYIPLVSNVSGAVRGLFGTAECIVGIVAFPFELLGRVMTPVGPHSSFLFDEEFISRFSWDFAVNFKNCSQTQLQVMNV